MEKSIFKSKTFWLNLLASVVSTLVVVDPELLTIFGVAPEKQVKILGIIGLVTGLANKVLRVMTNSAVSVPGLKK